MTPKDLIQAKFSAQKLQHRLQETDSALQEIEDELADFMEAYYARVGTSMKMLLELRRELRDLQRETFTRQPITEVSEQFLHLPANQLKDTIRQLYRELARDCHPDCLGAEAGDLASERMKHLNAAYTERNLSALWRLKWEMMQERSGGALSHKERLTLYKAQVTQMQDSLEALNQREASLKQSEAYQLMQHARFMRLAGQDFLSLAENRMQAEIAETRAALARARRQQHYWHVMQRQEAPVSA